ncbi:hypothetical protein BY458DRAFT_539908 [Sporodiniella umbellata]|nr:hypothetical protein BY458DRAFT_539908 [Sporodiniella umbellata]
MDMQLSHDPTLINAKFESYKLRSCAEIATVSRFDLSDAGINTENDSTTDHTKHGFRDLQARFRQNHLFYGYPLDENRSSNFLVDKDYQLHIVVFDKRTEACQFHCVSQLIRPIGSIPSYAEPDKNVPIGSQSCSILAISNKLLLASNGVGDIELIGIEEKNGRFLGVPLGFACYTGVGNEGIQPVPCYLLTVRQVKQHVYFVVCSRAASKNTEFHIATLEFEIPSVQTTERAEDGSIILSLNTLHIQTGPEVPVYCAITPNKYCILASETKYNQAQNKDDIPTNEIAKTPLYKWSQEGQDITIWIQLPEATPKAAVSCQFLCEHLCLIVKDTPITLPFRKFWGTVRTEDCVWTIEDNQLTMFLTKTEPNTRWPQIFEKDDGIPETLSVSQLADINSSLAKFTSDEQQGPVQAIQHPSVTAMDVDDDIDDLGQPIFFSVYDIHGHQTQEISSYAYNWIGSSFQDDSSLGSVCLGLDVDGLVFKLSEEKGEVQIKHTDTLDAFSFVQASKRDARYIMHDFSLHFGCIIESNRNAYIYFHHNDKRAVEAQTLVDVTLGGDVNVIGAQLIMNRTIMILTETQVVTIQLK